jgi:hypothetical protein
MIPKGGTVKYMCADSLYFHDAEDADIRKTLHAYRKRYPDAGVVALVAEQSSSSVPFLQQTCREAEVALAGGVFPELITGSRFRSHGVLLLCMPEMPDYILRDITGCDAVPAERVDQLAGHILDRLKGDGVLFFIFDALIPNVASVLDGLYLRLADRVQYGGVCAGSETFRPQACLFDSERFIQGGVLILLMPQGRGAMLEHGYSIPVEQIVATSSHGNCIRTIDWRPAFDIYRELIRKQYDEEVTRENFFKFGVHFPFGIVRANGEVLVRIPVDLTDDGSLHCIGEVPENAMLVLLHARDEELMDGALRLANRVSRSAADHHLIFYCAGRKLHLGRERAQVELDAIHSVAGDVAGALSLGEIGNVADGSYPLFHNAALVCSPVCV